MRRRLAWALVRLALRMNALSLRLLDLAERAWPGEPTKPGRMAPAGYTAASFSVRVQAALDPQRKAQRRASA